MKWLILATCLSAILIVDSRRGGDSRRKCATADQCPDENECCVKSPRRSTGICTRHGATSEPCRKEEDNNAADGTYDKVCPCLQDTNCESMTGLRRGDRNYFRSLRCRTPASQELPRGVGVGEGEGGEQSVGPSAGESPDGQETGRGTESAPGAQETGGEGTDGGEGV